MPQYQNAEVPLAFHSGEFTEMIGGLPNAGFSAGYIGQALRAGKLPGNGFCVEHEFYWSNPGGGALFDDYFVGSSLKMRLDRACYAIMKTRWQWWQDPAYSTSTVNQLWICTSENSVPDLLGDNARKMQVSASDTVYNTTGMIAIGPRRDQTENILEPDLLVFTFPSVGAFAGYPPKINKAGGFIALRLELYELPGNTAGQYPDGEESLARDAPAEQAADPYFLIEGVKR